jgi:hypothetical protein
VSRPAVPRRLQKAGGATSLGKVETLEAAR